MASNKLPSVLQPPKLGEEVNYDYGAFNARTHFYKANHSFEEKTDFPLDITRLAHLLKLLIAEEEE